jgi:hypothetical protein
MREHTTAPTMRVAAPCKMARILAALITMFVVPHQMWGAERVHALYDPRVPGKAPFPTDRFTTTDPAQITGLRINLPLPDCGTRPSDCADVRVLNTLDGFNVLPRVSIPFDGPIDVRSVTSRSVFMVKLPAVASGRIGTDDIISIDQVVWDPETLTVHAVAKRMLDQHTTYALIVTSDIRDENGRPVRASADFRNKRSGESADATHELARALAAARAAGVSEHEVVSASVFTTRSVTALLEQIRQQIRGNKPSADFKLGPNNERTVFTLNQIRSLTLNQQTKVQPPEFAPSPVRIDLLNAAVPGAVDRIAFGRYASPDYQVHPGEFIPPTATRTGVPVVQGMNEVYFDLYLPAGAKPSAGWPVAMLGHGGASNKQFGLPRGAAVLASHGIASVAINAVGHGFGPAGTLTALLSDGVSVVFPAGGRGRDQNGDGVIDVSEGRYAGPPQRFVVDDTDGSQQNVADLMQLVRTIEMGMDVDSDGSPEIDASRIYFFGQSYGASFGAMLLAIEPNVRAGVLISPGVAPSSALPMAPAGRVVTARLLAGRTPSLLNAPGIVSLEGLAVGGPFFNDDLPLENGSTLHVRLEDGATNLVAAPVVNTVPGARAIQEVFEWRRWVMQAGNTAAYAPYLRKHPLPGMSPKRVLIQAGLGDQTLPNPGLAQIAEAGELADRITLYRNDLAVALEPRIPHDPHTFAFRLDSPIPVAAAISRAVQEQMAVFFASDGTQVIHPAPSELFEPLLSAIPVGLNYLP